MLLERVGDEHEPFLEPDRPGVGDALDDEVAGILNRRQDVGVRAGGGPVEGGRGPAVQGLVGPLVIGEAAEGGERPLLQRQRGPRRANRLACERLVHPLVGPILLRLGRPGCVGAECRAGATTR